MLSRLAVELLAGFLSLTLVATGLAKLLAFRVTARQVGGGIVPARLAGPLVAGLIAVELGLGAAIGLGIAPVLSAGAAVGLFAAFGAYRVLLLRHDPGADCGCDGTASAPAAAGRPELALAHAHSGPHEHAHDHAHAHDHGPDHGHDHGHDHGPDAHDHGHGGVDGHDHDDAPDRIDVGTLVAHGPTRERVLSLRLASLGLLALAGAYAALTWSGVENGPVPGLVVLATVAAALALRTVRSTRA